MASLTYRCLEGVTIMDTWRLTFADGRTIEYEGSADVVMGDFADQDVVNMELKGADY